MKQGERLRPQGPLGHRVSPRPLQSAGGQRKRAGGAYLGLDLKSGSHEMLDEREKNVLLLWKGPCGGKEARRRDCVNRTGGRGRQTGAGPVPGLPAGLGRTGEALGGGGPRRSEQIPTGLWGAHGT